MPALLSFPHFALCAHSRAHRLNSLPLDANVAVPMGVSAAAILPEEPRAAARLFRASRVTSRDPSTAICGHTERRRNDASEFRSHENSQPLSHVSQASPILLGCLRCRLGRLSLREWCVWLSQTACVVIRGGTSCRFPKQPHAPREKKDDKQDGKRNHEPHDDHGNHDEAAAGRR